MLRFFVIQLVFLYSGILNGQIFNNTLFKAKNIQLTQLDIVGDYDQFGITKIKYGIIPPLPLESNTTLVNGSKIIRLQNLLPATTYKIDFINGSNNSVVGSEFYCTAANSKGDVRLYFTHRLNGDFKEGDATPDGVGGSLIVDDAINLINNAKTSIEVALYNTDRVSFVSALKNARSRGLKVRYITDDETGNSALSPTPNFSVLKVNSDGLMHNKFILIDADSDTSSWVIGGSMNFTTNNMFSDFNNTVFIQDKSLARNYRTEFDEMWGGNALTPNIALSKSGNDKVDNTAHQYNIKGLYLEQFFSPSDNLTENIRQVIRSANNDIRFALLTFTKSEIAGEILNKKLQGLTIKGICDNSTDPGSQINGLIANGVNVLVHTPFNQVHHKYTVVDAQIPLSDPTVLSGSHNWTNAAEFNNDENTMIFHSPRIANLFLQEFEGRWCEMTVANCVLDTKENLLPLDALEFYPNPCKQQLNIKTTLKNEDGLTLELLDLQGRILKFESYPYQTGYVQWNTNALPAGEYFIRLTQDKKTLTKKLLVIN